MTVSGGGVEALFWRGPVTPGDVASWLSPGVLTDSAAGSGSGFMAQPPYYFPHANQASIRAAAAAANAASGGYVMIPAGTISISSSALPMYAGVIYQGAGISYSWTGHNLTAGTILEGNSGAINCFEYNPTDQGALPGGGILASAIAGAGIRDLGIQNFAYGIKLGAKFIGGVDALVLDNVVVRNCSEWNFWLENCFTSKIANTGALISFDAGKGHVAKGTSGSTDWDYGNEEIGPIIAQGLTGRLNCRGVCFFARNTSTMNFVKARFVQCNGASTTYTFTPTSSNGSANLGVSDLTKFCIGTTVYVQTTAAGYSANRTYIVSAVSAASGAGTIQLAFGWGSSAVVATSSSPPQMVTSGPANLEITGWDVNSTIEYFELDWSDTEGGGAADVWIENTNNSHITIGRTSGGNTTNVNTLVCRNIGQNTEIHLTGTIARLDSDLFSIVLSGMKPKAISHGSFLGFVIDEAAVGSQLHLSENNVSTGELYVTDKANFGLLTLGASLKWQFAQCFGADTWNGQYGNYLVYMDAGAETFTLPAIDNNLRGTVLIIVNAGAGILTISSSSSQTFNGSGTTFNIAAHTMAFIGASKTGATFFWAKGNIS